MPGKLYGVGVGPGDPQLLTLRAHQVLTSVPVVAVPVSRPGEDSLALRVVRPWLAAGQEVLELLTPMVWGPAELEPAWEKAVEELLRRLRRGLDVAFITLGDASLYSTYGYLVRRLGEAAPEIVVETVPGVPSFCAAAARLNLPLALGAEPLAILPVLEEPEELRSLLRTFPNLVLMKFHRRYADLIRVLAEEGRLHQAVLASRCGWEDEKLVLDLNGHGAQEMDYLSLIIVKGEAVR